MKALAYAKSGITDYWILDVNCMYIAYQVQMVIKVRRYFRLYVTISPLAFGDCAIALRELLRPAS